jgi:phosphoribosylformylglycinamidine synthase
VWAPGNGPTGHLRTKAPARRAAPSIEEALPRLLSHPNIASKHWIVRQYDHEVRGGTVLKPLVGPTGRGPGDASILQPVPGSARGLSVACGLQTGIGDPTVGGDPYLMTLAAIDECVRNLVCVGTDPARIAILDNFCWPSCKRPENLGSLVRAAEGCYDGALAYRTPFVSGKDSLNNQLTVTNADGTTTTIEIPPTLLITGMGIVQDVRKAVSMDAKKPGRMLITLGVVERRGGTHAMRGSIYEQVFGMREESRLPRVDLQAGPAAARLVHELIRAGLVRSAHDVSEGGVLVCVAEMLIAGSTSDQPIGARLTFQTDVPDAAELFAEAPSTYVLEVDGDDASLDRISMIVAKHADTCGDRLGWTSLGELDHSGRMSITARSGAKTAWNVEDLASAWLKPLDW